MTACTCFANGYVRNDKTFGHFANCPLSTRRSQARRSEPLNWTQLLVALGALITLALLVAFGLAVIVGLWLLMGPQ